MPSKKKSLSLADQIAELSNPIPKDFDPEDDRDFDDGSQDGSEDQSGSDLESLDEELAREHYVAVGKSKLRKDDDLHLDPKYSGTKVDRAALYGLDSGSGDSSDEEEDGDSEEDEDMLDDEDESDDEEEEDAIETSIAPKPKKTLKVNGFGSHVQDHDLSEEDDEDEDEDQEDNSQSDEDMGDGEQDESESDSEQDNARRARLRKLMMEDQKNAVNNLSKAAKADVDKGIAVRDQRAAFDSFLNSRIKLQKAVIAVNSLGPTVAASDSLKEAESAALALWNTISNLRQEAIASRAVGSDETASKKRKHAEITSDTQLSKAWSTLKDIERSSTAWRNATLERWSAKLQTSSVPLTKKLNQSVAVQTIASQMREQLLDTDRLVSRTRVPRVSAPLQMRNKDVEQDPEIYDDSDFYQVLLKALVDQRMVDSASSGGAANGGMQWTLSEIADLNVKRKKNVDTKASKGRKLRYHVHEKLQNFMTPENNLEWHEQQIDELFSSILGQRLKVDEESSSEDEQEDVLKESAALMLFRSQPVA